ncbi:MAG TPA: type II toxin-antitoxin system VapC family toxin [Aquificaceae bacterium]|nr:type II toxin-antitoxin system VapC family toxin [Aquificaceae bacterium]
MKIGLDTGFILGFYLQDEGVLRWWERIMEKGWVPVTSILCGYEFFKVLLVRGYRFEELEEFWRKLENACEVVEVSGGQIREGARLEARYRLGAMDSLILAGFLEAGCRKVFTTDGRWKERVRKIKIAII